MVCYCGAVFSFNFTRKLHILYFCFHSLSDRNGWLSRSLDRPFLQKSNLDFDISSHWKLRCSWWPRERRVRNHAMARIEADMGWRIGRRRAMSRTMPLEYENDVGCMAKGTRSTRYWRHWYQAANKGHKGRRYNACQDHLGRYLWGSSGFCWSEST